PAGGARRLLRHGRLPASRRTRPRPGHRRGPARRGPPRPRGPRRLPRLTGPAEHAAGAAGLPVPRRPGEGAPRRSAARSAAGPWCSAPPVQRRLRSSTTSSDPAPATAHPCRAPDSAALFPLSPALRQPPLILEVSTGRASLTGTGQRSWTGRYLQDQRPVGGPAAVTAVLSPR